MWKTIKERWNAETPKLFCKIRNLAMTLGGSATAVWLANSSMSLELHPSVLSFCKYIIAFCAAIGISSQLQVQK